MKLDDRTEVLVAIGSAAAVNCDECLRHLTERAKALDVGAQETTGGAKIGLGGHRAAGEQTTPASNARRGAWAHCAAEQDVAAVDGRAGTAGHGCCGAPAERGV